MKKHPEKLRFPIKCDPKKVRFPTKNYPEKQRFPYLVISNQLLII